MVEASHHNKASQEYSPSDYANALLLLSEYTDKLNKSCARLTRIRFILKVFVFFFIIGLALGIVSSLLNYTNLKTTESFVFEHYLYSWDTVGLAIAASFAGYFVSLLAFYGTVLGRAKRDALDHTRLLEAVLSRVSQYADNIKSGNLEREFEYEIRLVEAENSLDFSEAQLRERSFYSDNPTIAVLQRMFDWLN